MKLTFPILASLLLFVSAACSSSQHNRSDESEKSTPESEVQSNKIGAQLYDIFALTEQNGRAISGAEFRKGVPTLELNTQQLTAMGHDGCNNFNGSIEVSADTITFGLLASTRMACPPANYAVNFISALAEHSFSYEREGLQLRLVREDQTLMFKKVD